MRTKNLTSVRLYRIWVAMRNRCNNPKTPRYSDYGGRGITICAEWDSYEVFQKWALSHGYREDLTIDRINNDGNYSPDNCRWVTKAVQNRNSRSCTMIEYKGEKHCIKEWCEILCLPYGSVQSRRRYGWPIEKAFETPFRSYRKAI